MFSEIDKGINDVENGRQLPLDETFEVVGKLRNMDIAKVEKQERQQILNLLITRLQLAEKAIIEEGTVSADEIEVELGIQN